MIPLPGFIYSLLKDLGSWGLAWARGRRLSSAEVIRLRAKWKTEFEENIYQTRKQKLREDVIIRDIKRMDTYPDLDQRHEPDPARAVGSRPATVGRSRSEDGVSSTASFTRNHCVGSGESPHIADRYQETVREPSRTPIVRSTGG